MARPCPFCLLPLATECICDTDAEEGAPPYRDVETEPSLVVEWYGQPHLGKYDAVPPRDLNCDDAEGEP